MASNTNTVNTAQNKSLTYNLLNLPQVVTVPTGTVTYTYDATGNKLRKVDVLGGVTTTHDYINGIQYENSTTAIAFIQTEEGKAALACAGANYTYYLGDNLGNTRRTFETRTGSAAMIQSDDYYPFGMEISNTPHIPKNEYLYNRKELQEELNEYDYGARFYDPVIGRWNTIDPLAEVSRRWSPYNYVEDDPIRNTDPDGMACYDCEMRKHLFDKENEGGYHEGDPLPTEKLNHGYGAKAGGDGGKKGGGKKKDDDDPISSKIERYTNYLALGTIVIGLGPEDPAADVVAGGEEVVGQTAAGLFKLGELTVDLWNFIHLSKGGHQNIWPDQYGYPPNAGTVDWKKSDQQLADEKSKAAGDTKKGPGTANNKAKKWFRDKRPKK